MVDLNMPPEVSQERLNIGLGNADMMEDNVEGHEGSAIRDSMMNLYEVNPNDGYDDDDDDEPTKFFDDGDEEEEMNYYDAMTLDWSFTHGGSEEDPRNEFNIGKQFENKEEVMLAVKRYIKRAVEYKILKINQLRYDVQYPTISIRALQRGVENHFGYKASYRKVWLAKQRVIARIYGGWEESYNELSHWLFTMQMYLPDVDEGHRIQLKHVNTMNVYQFDRSRTMFKVEELAVVPGSRQQNYQVLFDEGMCDCGYFQALHVLCRHVLAACSHARFDWK
ncbi:hypothetical protein Ahy_Scaffold7g108332 [Arachis hypogaea]|uniref:SWIM-type domain-containing protein n=1 Tax=Arachis hypogaea TaxID=3818 RepID=A0A444WNZ3_ARAHY|nr:hypothetical protein Ahy_Scaffold7g108332 [Arachis hypogaea]